MSLPSNTQYTDDEVSAMVNAFFWWDRTANLWRYHHDKTTIVWAEHVVDGENARRWYVSWGDIHSRAQQESPAFGNLDSLLVWAKLEGLL
ncbi:hypothetical protein [Pseudomonas mediterranea]|uniref:hypothetical protein n=1 Tax=Pseudomonas mediterranea TaxID=183795 RepID=UPI0006D8AEB5|nr:hypothetical protein [Pseudomonas mediterranea]